MMLENEGLTIQILIICNIQGLDKKAKVNEEILSACQRLLPASVF